jgi:hypothetical protein
MTGYMLPEQKKGDHGDRGDVPYCQSGFLVTSPTVQQAE